MLPDVSVSRRHAVLRRESLGYVLVDEGSGNGTRINGRSIRSARLRNGDEIALGDSIVQFVDAGDVGARSSVAARGMANAMAKWARAIGARGCAAIAAFLLAMTFAGVWGRQHRVAQLGGAAVRVTAQAARPKIENRKSKLEIRNSRVAGRA